MLTSQANSKPLSDQLAPPLWYKCLSGVLIFVFFELGYIWGSAGHSVHSAYIGNSALDALIPNIPVFIVPYILGYLFVFVPLFLFKSRSDYYWGVSIFIFSISFAFIIFKICPVFMYKTLAESGSFFADINRTQQTIDTPFNNCPSLHVTLNVYCWGLLFLRFGKRMLWLIWAPALIVLSTLFVKQHLVIDVIAGLALGGIMCAAFHYLKHKHYAALICYRCAWLLAIFGILANYRYLEDGYKVVSSLVTAAPLTVAILGVLVSAIVFYYHKRTH